MTATTSHRTRRRQHYVRPRRVNFDTCRFGPAAPDEPTVHRACRPGAGPPNEDVDAWLSVVRDRGSERVCRPLARRQLASYDDPLGTYEAAFGPDAVRHAR